MYKGFIAHLTLLGRDFLRSKLDEERKKNLVLAKMYKSGIYTSKVIFVNTMKKAWDKNW